MAKQVLLLVGAGCLVVAAFFGVKPVAPDQGPMTAQVDCGSGWFPDTAELDSTAVDRCHEGGLDANRTWSVVFLGLGIFALIAAFTARRETSTDAARAAKVLFLAGGACVILAVIIGMKPIHSPEKEFDSSKDCGSAWRPVTEDPYWAGPCSIAGEIDANRWASVAFGVAGVGFLIGGLVVNRRTTDAETDDETEAETDAGAVLGPGEAEAIDDTDPRVGAPEQVVDDAPDPTAATESEGRAVPFAVQALLVMAGISILLSVIFGLMPVHLKVFDHAPGEPSACGSAWLPKDLSYESGLAVCSERGLVKNRRASFLFLGTAAAFAICAWMIKRAPETRTGEIQRQVLILLGVTCLFACLFSALRTVHFASEHEDPDPVYCGSVWGAATRSDLGSYPTDCNQAGLDLSRALAVLYLALGIGLVRGGLATDVRPNGHGPTVGG